MFWFGVQTQGRVEDDDTHRASVNGRAVCLAFNIEFTRSHLLYAQIRYLLV